jgi:hypothetical protein
MPMPGTYTEAHRLTDRLDTLCEPYRQNAIAWLQLCTQSPMDDPRAEMQRFLSDLNPIVRETFIRHAGRVLEEAVRYFGVKKGATSPLRTQPGQGSFQNVAVVSA